VGTILLRQGNFSKLIYTGLSLELKALISREMSHDSSITRPLADEAIKNLKKPINASISARVRYCFHWRSLGESNPCFSLESKVTCTLTNASEHKILHIFNNLP
jgi:hypothetical protein